MKFLRNDSSFKQRRRDLRRDQTDAEKLFWAHIRNRQIHGMKFYRQYGIGPYILDFYCPKAKLAVEIDGGQHLQKEGREYDDARSEYLETLGITVVRYWNNEVMNSTDDVLSHLRTRVTPQVPLS